MKHQRKSRHAVAVAAVGLVLMGCDESTTPPMAPEVPAAAVAAVSLGPEVSGWLAGVRAATADFHRIDAAADAGWSTAITGCMEMTGQGGMGYHFGNVDLIDGTAEALAPEVLLYEPDRLGRMHLVGVEYVVPFAFVPADAPPPTLHGVAFEPNHVFGLWALHAWIWKENRTGVFSDWNPQVTCLFAQ